MFVNSKKYVVHSLCSHLSASVRQDIQKLVTRSKFSDQNKSANPSIKHIYHQTLVSFLPVNLFGIWALWWQVLRERAKILSEFASPLTRQHLILSDTDGPLYMLTTLWSFVVCEDRLWHLSNREELTQNLIAGMFYSFLNLLHKLNQVTITLSWLVLVHFVKTGYKTQQNWSKCLACHSCPLERSFIFSTFTWKKTYVA